LRRIGHQWPGVAALLVKRLSRVMSSEKQQFQNQPEASRRASEYRRLHELTRHFQILDEVFEAFGDPDQSPYCGIIRSRSDSLANLQQWRDEQAKRRSRFFARLIRRFVGDHTPAPPEWETVRDGPKWIYTTLSDMLDVHVGIHPTGRVAIRLFNKGEDDAA